MPPPPTPPANPPTERFTTVRGVRLAHLDHGGPGTPLLALHGHFGRARTFSPLAAALAPHRRVIALEQRAHGHSGSDGDVTPDAYADDAAAFLRALGLGPVDVLGHSMGGVTAFRLAARAPDLVRTLVVEEGGADNRPPLVPHPVLDTRAWPRRAPSLDALRRAIAAQGVPDPAYFLESAVEHPDGWGLLLDHDELYASQTALVGDHWPDWLASSCPALLLHGRASTVLPTALAREMAARRPRTLLREFPAAGHWLHDDDPDGFAHAVARFLDTATTAAPPPARRVR
ncbi:alpha/beta fold hydrolase [Streptomyces avicenniae]|uniref:alpha/beta fold hydrolase n=1 Tax=Streptomyces avicenniae TaxID=500153 RepID=UPI00069C72BC|nr:alpha/beta hydrolase [Streptomyces avicenniae]